MTFQDLANAPRAARTIDPAVYEFLAFLYDHRGKILPVFSCQGHRQGEPAWVSFEVKDEVWFCKLVKALPPYCRFDGETLNIFHKNKFPDLRNKLIELQGIIDSL